MLRVAPDTLRADVQRFYGLNLDDTGSNIRVRRMADLAANLPDTARIWSVIDPRAQWTTTQHLLANIADNTAFLAFCKTKEASNGKRFKNLIKRPGDTNTANNNTVKTGHIPDRATLYQLLNIN